MLKKKLLLGLSLVLANGSVQAPKGTDDSALRLHENFVKKLEDFESVIGEIKIRSIAIVFHMDRIEASDDALAEIEKNYREGSELTDIGDEAIRSLSALAQRCKEDAWRSLLECMSTMDLGDIAPLRSMLKADSYLKLLQIFRPILEKKSVAARRAKATAPGIGSPISRIEGGLEYFPTIPGLHKASPLTTGHERFDNPLRGVRLKPRRIGHSGYTFDGYTSSSSTASSDDSDDERTIPRGRPVFTTAVSRSPSRSTVMRGRRFAITNGGLPTIS